jgi:hypothetical protein
LCWFSLGVAIAYRDKKVVGVFVRFSCAASERRAMTSPAVLGDRRRVSCAVIVTTGDGWSREEVKEFCLT